MAYNQQKVNSGPLSGNPFEFVTSITVENWQGVTAQVGTPTVTVTRLANDGSVRESYGATVPSNGDAGYAVGSIFWNTSGGAGSTLYVNEGSSTSAAFAALATADSSVPAKGHYSISVETNGATPVNVFGSGGAPVALTITSVLSIAQDATAGNITLAEGSGPSTVVTIAKGTTSGGVVGGISLANTAIAAGAAVTIVSSSVGNSIVVIGYTV